MVPCLRLPTCWIVRNISSLARDRVDKRLTLDEQKVNVKDHTLVVILDVRGQRNWGKNRDPRNGAGARCLSFKRGNVGTVDQHQKV